MALYKRNGTWYCSYRDLNGEWIRESTKTQNKKVALQIYHTRLDELALKKAGVYEEEKKTVTPELEEFKEDYVDYLKGNKRAPNTIELNKYAFDNLIAVLGNKNLREISQRDIEKWKKKALETLVDTSVNIYQRSLVTAFGVAVRWEYLKKSPFEDVQVIHAESEKQKPKVYSQEQLQKLFGNVRRKSLRWARLFELYLVSGMRRNELIYLEWSDVSWRSGKSTSVTNLKGNSIPRLATRGSYRFQRIWKIF